MAQGNARPTPPPIRTPLLEGMARLLSRPWLLWVQDVFRATERASDGEAGQAFEPEAASDQEPKIRTQIELLRDPASGRLTLDVDELRATLALLDTPVRSAADLAELKTALASSDIRNPAGVDDLRAGLAAVDPPQRPDLDDLKAQIAVADLLRAWRAELDEALAMIAMADAANGNVPKHASTHQNGGSDEVAVSAPAANAIPKADANATLNSWVTAPLIKDVVNLTGQTASIPATNLPVDGGIAPAAIYRVSVAAACTTAGAAGLLSVNITYTANGIARNYLAASLTLTSTNNFSTGHVTFYSDGGVHIQYSTTVSGASGVPQYAVQLTLEKLS